jgi:UDP-GlcNAc3NAcA epimerase
LKKVLTIIGARPQFIKHFAFEKAAQGLLNIVTIHTGQHYDDNMSKIFFDELGMQRPDYLLELGGGNHGMQTGRMMMDIEEIVMKEKPDMMVVFGDTNSTLAGALVASKLHIKLAHIEAGLRSYNKEMPEEINRILTDHVSDLLFVPSQIAVNNLLKEGISQNVHVVGDIMKDLVVKSQKESWLKRPEDIITDYFYVTLHRPYNTDEKDRLSYVLEVLNGLSKQAVFAIHPRTQHAMSKYGMDISQFPNIKFIDPQGYMINLSYLAFSDGLITDSGGMQKEAYWLKKPCVTIRKETEWVETLEGGNNTLMYHNLDNINQLLSKEFSNGDDTLYGNGSTGDLIVNFIKNY